ncbi:class I SAM-dependent methyltransferase [Vogesella indigofera]|uniref:class I SAM-dependent methyltransferase n=1 Tax=Vogesella indigofera TaxID=45465 RepID=UPI00234EA03C|nr:class I SAM-dependent methyltransferase [Vogesella indigofera]MDC7698217.1 class I SAM-dependent methyltransferase [Vogesella indigofera]
MSDTADFWNTRFAVSEFIYGEAPNDFLREQASRLAPGSRVLSLGEGEGRNALFLAKQGHALTAVDASHEGLAKVLARAAAAGVDITAVLADLARFEPGVAQFDAVVSVFCHLPSALRRTVMTRAMAALKPGGLLIMEGYTPRQLAFGTGGPKDADMLLEAEIVRGELVGLELLHFVELEREVIEGSYHTGTASVLQVVARKP